MKFARLPLTEAEGTILAHSIATPKGTLKKGRTVGPAEMALLKAAGIAEVVAARLEPGDVGEDVAAARVARAATGAYVRDAPAFTGRANLFADKAGLAVLDEAAIAELNAIDEGLTIATVPAFERVTPGQMLATVKIITFSVPETAVARAEELARAAGGVVRIAPLVKKTAGLILTRLPATKANVLAKRQAAIASRLDALGSTLGPVETVAHEEAAVKAAIVRLAAAGADPIIVFAASAIVDRGDVIPSALVQAGGDVIRLGMPVDPGNLMMLGTLGERDVIGAPSCAASPKLNGFDWILERRLAGLPIGARDVAAMGIGGLLKEIPSRPQPRDQPQQRDDGMADSDDGARHAPRIAALVLAAGRSTRFGADNKLLADLDGKPIIRRTVEAVLASQARPVTVVTGHMADAVKAALAGLDVTFVHNADYATGLSASLKAGIRALPAGLDGCIIALGDMPRVTATHIDRLISGFAPKEGRSIVVPIHAGAHGAKRGNPVLFASTYLSEMLEVAGDTGARHIIGYYADEVAEVDLGSDAIFIDVDTQEALARLKNSG